MGRRKKRSKVDWTQAPDIKKRVFRLIKDLELEHINLQDVYFLRSNNSSSRSYARIWGLSKVWQMSLKTNPSYIIEVLSERFDKLSEKEKDKVLLHEIAHIPQNFSGSLLPHIRKRGKRNFHDRVEELYAQYLKQKNR